MNLKYTHRLSNEDTWEYTAFMTYGGRRFILRYMWDYMYFKSKTLSEKKILVRRTRALLENAMAWEYNQLEKTLTKQYNE